MGGERKIDHFHIHSLKESFFLSKGIVANLRRGSRASRVQVQPGDLNLNRLGRRHEVRVHAHLTVLRAHARPLDNELLLAELEPVQAGNGLISNVRVGVLAKGVPLGEPSGRVLDQVERPQLAEADKELLDLVAI